MALKRLAPQKVVSCVHDSMVDGLGTGSTAGHMIELLGNQIRCGELSVIVGIPTCQDTARRPIAAGIPPGDLADSPRLDLAVDGADEGLEVRPSDRSFEARRMTGGIGRVHLDSRARGGGTIRWI